MNLSLTLTNGRGLLSHIWLKRAFYHTEWCRGDQITGTCATFGAARNLGPHEARKAAPARAIAAQCRPGRALARPYSSRACEHCSTVRLREHVPVGERVDMWREPTALGLMRRGKPRQLAPWPPNAALTAPWRG